MKRPERDLVLLVIGVACVLAAVAGLIRLLMGA